MSIIVQKFGGTSVGSPSHIKRMASRVMEEKNRGNAVVVVVSAMGDTTDTLAKLASEITSQPKQREMDMLLSTGEQVTIALLAMALQERGAESISFTGGQAGIHTDSVHGNAKIKTIDGEPILRELDAGKIVVVAGFQGITEEGYISTLGRGGSDTTAAALAAQLEAERCDIYTDVDGVYTSDPRYIKKAAKISSLTYDDMLNLAAGGAGVLHPRSVKHAKKYGIPMVVRSSLTKERGTFINHSSQRSDRYPVIGIVFQGERTSITLSGLEGGSKVQSAIRAALETRNIECDFFKNHPESELTLLVQHNDVKESVELLSEGFKFPRFTTQGNLAKVAVIGSNIRTHPVIQGKAAKVLNAEHIEFKLIEDLPGSVTAAVPQHDMHLAAGLLHTAFGLDVPEMRKVVAVQ
ncbi:aspartate kinase [Rossellomorea oryzaecorticis]|uniref:Aspartokinase n=1 Tax=Rossellomorea oryzaecorticis TaxID=1396505 RepID=A0ABU9K943_9BACI